MRRPTRVAALATALVVIGFMAWQCAGTEEPRPEPPPAAVPPESVEPPPTATETSLPTIEIGIGGGAGAGLAKGTVRTSSGEPAGGLFVFCTGPAVLRAMRETEASGEEMVAPGFRGFRLEDGVIPPAWRAGVTVDDGRWLIWTRRFGAGPHDLLLVRKDGEGRHRIVHRIARADPSNPGDVRIPEAGTIRGVVKSREGQTVDRALVYCVPLDVVVEGSEWTPEARATPFTRLILVDYARHARTGADGGFRIDGVRPVPYRLFARRRAFGGVVRRVMVRSGAETLEQEVVLDIAAAYLSGRIVDARTQDPLPGCLLTTADRRQGIGYTAADGTFRIGPLAPGEFRGRVLKMDYEPTPLGPFRLEAGKTFKAPTVYATRKE